MSHTPRNKFAKAAVLCALFGLLSLATSPAMAHVGVHDSIDFRAGFSHPFSGLDHLLAMLAVGIWAAQMQGRAKWLLPLSFPPMMVVGALLGWMGQALPGIEFGIAVSVAMLGGMIALSIQPPIAVGTALVAAFAVAHGYAHGAELPHQASAGTYAVGFVVATAMLHAVGLSAGLLAKRSGVSHGLRLAGGGIAAYGLLLMAGFA